MHDDRIALIGVTDGDFQWMLGEGPSQRSNLQLPPGGADDPAILQIVRKITQRLHDAHCQGSWMIVSGVEVVGLCSYRRPPQGGSVEIGYGIAASRRNRGYATLAVAQIVQQARRDREVQRLVAETSISNPPSMRVLEKNGFARIGSRVDDDDGCVALWQKAIDR